jgi:hypothetical protein
MDALTLATITGGLTAKATPIDADKIGFWDSVTSLMRNFTFANLWTWIQAKIHGAANKDTLVDADKIAIVDTEAANVTKTTTWTNIKAKIWTALGGLIAGGTNKATIVDADKTSLSDSADTNATKYATAANWFTYVSSKLGAWLAGLTDKTTPIDADNLLLSDSNATNASKKLTFANLWAWVIGKIEASTATTTPNDTDVVLGVKADHTSLKYTWANLKAAIYLKIYDWIIALTAKTTPAAADVFQYADSVGLASKSITFAQLWAAIIAAGKATAANIVTGTSDLVLLTVKGLKDSLALADMWLTKRTKMPDGATALYSKLIFSDTTGFGGEGATPSILSVVGGSLRCEWSGTGYNRCYSSAETAVSGKKVRVKIRGSRNGIVVGGYPYIASVMIGQITLTTDWQYFVFQLPVNVNTRWGIIQLSCNSGDYFEISDYWVGDYSYLPGSLSEEAARIDNLHADMPGVGIYASQTITATDLATATKGDTIGGKKYTYVAALTASPGVEGEILKGATKEEDLENLNLAISEAARTNNGTKYWAAAVHPLVSSARVNAVLTLTAKTNNGPENAITVECEAGTNHTAGGATLLGGYTDSAAKTIAEAENNIAGGRTRPAAAKMELTNTAPIGYETTVDVASGGTLTLPAGGTWYWSVYGYGATISSAKRGSSAGGTTLTVAGANASVGYRRVA